MKPGHRFARSLDLGAGPVELIARDEATGEGIGRDVHRKVYDDQPEQERGHKRITRENAPSRILTLDAGDYLLVAEYRDRKAETRFSLAPGEQKPIEVVLVAGRA